MDSMPMFIKINKEDVPVRYADLPQADLKFYTENPRVHSLLEAEHITFQEDIEECMRKLEHVSKLKTQIETHGGLIDPLVVRDGDYTVLEGNSRLAAYRMLFDKNPAMWGKVRCQILPADIKDELVFQLLGQYHLAGKTEWSPFEQASFLARQLKRSKKPLSTLAKPLGIKEPTAKNMIAAYSFMKDHGDSNIHHYSHYLEYVKSPSIGKARDYLPELDGVIVKQVKNGEIANAQDIRKLGELTKSTSKDAKKIVKKIAEGEVTLEEGYEKVKETGVLDDVVKKLKRFQAAIAEESFEHQCLTHKDVKSVDYVLKQIGKQVTELRKKIEGVKAGK